jgi:hypothetical protein
MGGSKATVDHPAQARHAAGGAADYLSTMSPAGSPAETIDPRRGRGRGPTGEAPITVIIGGPQPRPIDRALAEGIRLLSGTRNLVRDPPEDRLLQI